MKGIAKFFLTAAILSGTLSFRTYRDGDALTVETTVSNPEAIIETAGGIISAADDALRALGNAVIGQPDAAAQSGASGFYRIRNAAGDAASQIGAYSDLQTAMAACPAGYGVFDEQNQLIYAG